MSVKSALGKQLNHALGLLNVQLIPGTSPDPAVKTFLSARKTIAAARKAGLPVAAYIDQTFAAPGATSALVKAMLELAGWPGRHGTVCEIGAGSGRFAEEVIAAMRPDSYEIYETARDWLPILRKLPNVVLRDCDGHTLAQTPDASVDLVHAQKVFVYIPFYTAAGYLAEMARVVRPGGTVAFDVVTEDCLDDRTVLTWTSQGSIYHPFPKAWTIGFMRQRGLEFRGSHITPLPPGTSELLVFRRD